jgi:hypothetical protein
MVQMSGQLYLNQKQTLTATHKKKNMAILRAMQGTKPYCLEVQI